MAPIQFAPPEQRAEAPGILDQVGSLLSMLNPVSTAEAKGRGRDAELQQAAAPYAGENGNLRFATDRPLPLELIDRITRLRVQQDSTRGGPGGRGRG